jgi:hypothetical protein
MHKNFGGTKNIYNPILMNCIQNREFQSKLVFFIKRSKEITVVGLIWVKPVFCGFMFYLYGTEFTTFND